MDYATDFTFPDCRPFGDHDNSKDPEGGLGDMDQWRFTPSMLDTNSFSFTSFANQHSGDFTPPPGGMNAMFHSQAGDLHTPGMAFQLGTPLSTDDSRSISAIDMQGFHPHLLHSQPFENTNPFPQQQSYAPSSFIHQDSGYDTMEQVNGGVASDHKVDESNRDAEFTALSANSYENAPVTRLPSVDK